MSGQAIALTTLFCLAPIFELRGAIPYGMSQDLPLLFLIPFCIILNALVGPLVYLFLTTAHRLLNRFNWYQRFFDFMVKRARVKVQT
ncbi:MAG: small multi-drug export protein, partial [Spirochaetales bacterium]|nr:small multi-drug export protein [Spirochaetales bacterium]